MTGFVVGALVTLLALVIGWAMGRVGGDGS